MKRSALAVALAASMSASALFVSRAAADPVASFYANKEVSIFVGAAPGGGFDLYARMVGQHLGRHIPGQPSVVVRNMPGAGGVNQVNFLLNRADRDGTQLGIVNPVMTTAPFLTPNVARWDSREFVWLGSANSEISTCAFWPGSKVTTLEEMKGGAREVVVAGVGPSSGATLDAITLRSLFGFRWRIVVGYSGLANAMVAADAGEVDGMCGLNVTTLKARLWDRVQSGDIKVLLQTSLRNHPDLPGVANAFDLAESAEQKSKMELVFAPWIFGRPFVTTPGVPAERVAALRAAFKSVLADPQFIAQAEKTNSEVSYMAPAEIEEIVQRFYATEPEIREKTREMLAAR